MIPLKLPGALAILLLLFTVSGCSSSIDSNYLYGRDLTPSDYTHIQSLVKKNPVQLAAMLKAERTELKELKFLCAMLDGGLILSAKGKTYYWGRNKASPVLAQTIPEIAGHRINFHREKQDVAYAFVDVPPRESVLSLLVKGVGVIFLGLLVLQFWPYSKLPFKKSAYERSGELGPYKISVPRYRVLYERIKARFFVDDSALHKRMDNFEAAKRNQDLALRKSRRNALPENTKLKAKVESLKVEAEKLKNKETELEKLRMQRIEEERVKSEAEKEANRITYSTRVTEAQIALEKKRLERLRNPPPPEVLQEEARQEKEEQARRRSTSSTIRVNIGPNEPIDNAPKPADAVPVNTPPPTVPPTPLAPGQASALIGKRLLAPGVSGPTEVVHDDEPPVVVRFAPRLKAFVEEQVPGAFVDQGGVAQEAPLGDVEADAKSLSRHSFVVGATGTGKTRLLVQMVLEQLKAGCSVIMVDPKEETLAHVYELALASGFPKERIDLLLPRLGQETRCCFDPLMGNPSSFASIMKGIAGSWGPRLQDLLVNSLVLIQRAEGSPLELVKFLQNEDYRAALMARLSAWPEKFRDPEMNAALDFFADEFGSWPAGQQTQAVAPVLNKLRDFTRNPFFLYATCGWTSGVETPMFDAGNYFSLEDNTNRLGLIHLDRESLGDESVKLFAGLVVNHVFFRSMKNTEATSRPTVLCMDEMAISERFVGDVIKDIIAISRAKNLRLMVACQNLSQLDQSLRSTLMANAAVQAYFRLGFEDAKIAADMFGVNAKECVSKVVVGRGTGKVPDMTFYFELYYQNGEPVTIKHRDRAIPENKKSSDFTAPELASLWFKRFSHHCKALDPESREKYELDWLKNHFPETDPSRITFAWDSEITRSVFPASRLEVAVPRPSIKSVEKMTRMEAVRAWGEELSHLPTGQCVIRMPSQGIFKAQVVQVPDPKDPDNVFNRHPRFKGAVSVMESVRRRNAAVGESGAGEPTPLKDKRKASDGKQDNNTGGGKTKYGSVSGDDPGL